MIVISIAILNHMMISNCKNDFSNYTNGYERKNMIDDDFVTYFDFVIDFGIGIDFWNYFLILIEIANGLKNIFRIL